MCNTTTLPVQNICLRKGNKVENELFRAIPFYPYMTRILLYEVTGEEII